MGNQSQLELIEGSTFVTLSPDHPNCKNYVHRDKSWCDHFHKLSHTQDTS